MAVILVAIAGLVVYALVRPRPQLPSIGPGPGERATQSAIERQSKALLAGDEAGWLATIDPANEQLVTRYRTIFRSLRAMRVSLWRPMVNPYGGSVAMGEVETNGTLWTLKLVVEYCLGAPTCPSYDPHDGTPRPPRFYLAGSWRMVNGRAVLTAEQEGHPARGTAPWESELVSVVGKRVVVAAPPALAARLPAVLPIAEDAAATADRYARFSRPPAAYIVYLASTYELKSWYGVGESVGEPGGYAVQLDRDSEEVVINMDLLTPDELPIAIRHEFGHVVAQLGSVAPATSFWLNEGIAEYIAFSGRPLTAYNRHADIKKFVSSGWWKGNVDIDQKPIFEISGAYGVAYLGVTCLATRYGDDRMLQFFGDVVRDRRSAVEAAQARLGQPWQTVNADCAQFVRQNAR
jgi:hypothetical protein